MAMLRERGGRSVTAVSPINTSPRVGDSRPAIMRNRVVLPQPEGPSRTRNSPSRTCRSMPSTAVTSPNRLVIPLVGTVAMTASTPLRLRVGWVRHPDRPRAGRRAGRSLPGAGRAQSTIAGGESERARRNSGPAGLRQPTGRWESAAARGAARHGRPEGSDQAFLLPLGPDALVLGVRLVQRLLGREVARGGLGEHHVEHPGVPPFAHGRGGIAGDG